jgi:hypothetical protein
LIEELNMTTRTHRIAAFALLAGAAFAVSSLDAQDTKTKQDKKILKQAWSEGDKGKVKIATDLKGKTSSSWTGQSWPFGSSTGDEFDLQIVKGGKLRNEKTGRDEAASPDNLDPSFLLPGKEAKAKLGWQPDAAKFTAFLRRFSGGDAGTLSCSKADCRVTEVSDDRVEIEVTAQIASKFDGGQAKRSFDVKMTGTMTFDLKMQKVVDFKLSARGFKIQSKWDQWDTDGEVSEFTLTYAYSE